LTEPSAKDKENFIKQGLAPAAGIIAALVVLYLISTVNYVLFHSIVEIITVVVSFSIFILVWNSRKYIDNAFFFVVGVGFLFSGGIDLVHMLAYKGMEVFPGNSSDLPTQLWIAARYLQAFSLILAPLAIGKKVRFSSLIIIFGIAFVVLLGAIFTGIFPHCFIEGTGLTPFKIGSEYVISILLAASMVLLYRHRRSFDKNVLNYLLAANTLTIVAELAFTSYISVYGFANMFGHLMRFVAVYLWYQAFFVVGQKNPYDLLWRELKENEERFFGLFDTISSGVAIYKVKNDGLYGRDYIIKDFNKMALQVEGYKKEDVVGKSLFDLRPTIDDYGLISVFRKVWKSGVPEYYPQKMYVDEKYANWYENRIFRLQSGEIVAVYNDVTDQKRNEEALKESENEYRSLFENMLEGFAYCRMLYDEKGRPTDFIYLNVNPAFDRIIGTKTVVGKPVTEVFSGIKEAFPSLFEIYGRVASTGEPESFDLDFKPSNKWLHISVYSPVKEYFVAIFEDITERRIAEEKLKFSNTLLSTQQEVSIDGILVVDSLGKIILYNQQFVNIWGIPQDVIASHSDERTLQTVLGKLVNPDEFIKRVRYLYEHKEEKSREEIVLLDGRSFDRYSAPMIGSDGNYFGRIWFFRDITDRKRMEESLRQEKDQWRGTFDSIPDYIAIIDANHHVLQVNKAMADALKVSPDAAKGIFCYQAVHGTTGPPSYCPHEMMLKDGKTHTTEVELPLLNGYFSLTTSPLFKPDGTIFGSVHLAHDITERKKAEDLLKHFNEELEQKVKARTEELNASLDEKVILLREVHHRVKNNLQILISLLNLQSRTFNDTQVIAALKESTQRIRAMSMVHEKLYSGSDLSHIDFISYLTTLAKSQVAFYQLEPGKVTLETTGENIMLDINTAIPLGLVMNELLSNSLKHAFPGDRKGTIRIDARETEGRLEISISDDGVGLPEGFDYSTSPSLGLRLVHILIEQLSGTIEPKKEKGTMFTIVIKEKQ
jgi:PAS domain S-box-containing protein